MLRRFATPDARGLVICLAVLAVLTPVYAALAERAGRPLSVFALVPLLAAAIGGWRVTAVVGAISLAVAVVVGIVGPLEPFALVVRWTIVAVAAVVACLGAWFRAREQAELLRLTESTALYHVFEAGLLPAPNPPPGYAVAARFVASEEHMTLSGDFLDAMALDDGRLAVVIGDVSGHGPHEAAFATAMRAGWRSIASTHRPDPAAWLTHLARTLFHGDSQGLYVTMCTGIIDRREHMAIVASAGHPAPVLLTRTATVATVEHGVPLGIGVPGTWRNCVLPIERRVLFYTDGLIENPRSDAEPDRWEEGGLLRWLECHLDGAVDEVADRLVEDALAGRVRRDDLGVLVVDLAAPND